MTHGTMVARDSRGIFKCGSSRMLFDGHDVSRTDLIFEENAAEMSQNYHLLSLPTNSKAKRDRKKGVTGPKAIKHKD